jgi:hypothetical protein
MGNKDNLYTGSLRKVNGKLKTISKVSQLKYADFIENLAEGQDVDVFMEVNTGDGTLAQLAKLHKCIRLLAAHTGNAFDDMKIYIKDLSGLLIRRTIENKEYCDWKSFGKCSKDDLNLAIQSCIELGDKFNLNLR